MTGWRIFRNSRISDYSRKNGSTVLSMKQTDNREGGYPFAKLIGCVQCAFLSRVASCQLSCVLPPTHFSHPSPHPRSARLRLLTFVADCEGAHTHTPRNLSSSLIVSVRDGRFGSKVGQIGPQIGQIRDFFRSDYSTFGSMSQMYWNLIWKSPGFVQFGVQSDPLWSLTYYPCVRLKQICFFPS